MNTLFRAFSLATATALLLAAQNGNSSDEQLIRKLLTDFAAARNALDAKAMASAFAEDGRYTATGEFLFSGRPEIERGWAQTFSQFPAGRASRTIHSVRFIEPGTAVADVDVTSSGFSVNPDLLDIYVLTKKSGEWKIAEAWTVTRN